jgi:hypothetical protein
VIGEAQQGLRQYTLDRTLNQQLGIKLHKLQHSNLKRLEEIRIGPESLAPMSKVMTTTELLAIHSSLTSILT